MGQLRVVAITATISLALYAPGPPVAAAVGQAPNHLATASEVTRGVVVNEFAPSMPAWLTDEFVELRNAGEKVMALGGWELVACLSPTTWRVAATFPEGAMISPGEDVLLAHPDYTAIGADPDFHYDVEVPEYGGWLLFDPWTGYADGVGLSEGLGCTEGSPAPKCDWAAGQAVTRDELGKDTDDNAGDFSCRSRTPGR